MHRSRRTFREAQVSSRSLVALDQAARAVGIALEATRWAPHFDPSDPAGQVPLAEQIAFCRALFSQHRETLGLDLAGQLPLESTGLWGFLLRSSATFGEMLARARRYQRIVNVFEEFELEVQEDRVAMVCNHPDPSAFGPREQVVLLLLGHWLVWGRQLSGHPMPVLAAHFRWKGPRDVEPFERFFQGPVCFRTPRDVLVLPKAYLDLPFRESAPEVGEAFEAYAAAMISRLTKAEDLPAEVGSAIEDGLLTGASNEAQVASELGMTPRTMHRRLTSFGTSFRKLKHAVIVRRAKELLEAAEPPLAEVSYLLGFSEPSSFHRAFRRWTGMTPAQWRQGR